MPARNLSSYPPCRASFRLQLKFSMQLAYRRGMTKPDDLLVPILLGNSPSIDQIANENADLIADLRRLEPTKTAATFAGLLTLPELQANCLRIEALVHLAAAYCEGRSAPTRGFVMRSFERVGEGYCGRMEDPAEDVFLALVNTPRGNFRIFEGIREGNGFCLQRILNVVETMPDTPACNRIRSSIDCLLKLSEAVAARAGLPENSLGGELPLHTLPRAIADRLPRARNLIHLGEHDLAQWQIPTALLADFAFVYEDRAALRGQSLGHTDLERRPILLRGQSALLLLPTAVGSAITRFVIERVLANDMGKAFERALAKDFAQLFRETPIVGHTFGVPIRWQGIDGGLIGGGLAEVDAGRFLDLIFFVDGLDGFLQRGLSGVNAAPDALASAVTQHIERASAHASGQPGFRDGMSLFVSCGFGRELHLELKEDLPTNWRFESIAAHDLVTLSWLSEFSPLSLWRLLDSREAIEREGTMLSNINGLLNLVAWSRRLDGHLLPHGKLPDEFSPGVPNIVVLGQNAVRDLRHSVMSQWNPRRILDSDKRWLKVRKLVESEFEEDNAAPLYASEDDVRNGRLRGVYLASKRCWWMEIEVPPQAPRDSVYEYWRMLCTWLERSAPVLEDAYDKLPLGPISFYVSFADITGTTSVMPKPKDANELRSLFHVSADRDRPLIKISVRDGFSDGLAQADNVAERAVVEALVAGAAEAGGELADTDKGALLVSRICPNSDARYMHRIRAHSFRDFVRPEISPKAQFIDSLDDGLLRIGLGWRGRSRDAGSELSGLLECTSYLNSVVRVILDDLCVELRHLDRDSFVRAALHNHEAAACDSDHWKRTTRANLALHDDKDAAIETIVRRHTRLNGSSMSSRILLEAAICECPLEGGSVPGQLDLSRAMARVMQVYHLGGWSDAIRWGAMKPIIKITPLGDVHADQSFIDTIYEQFGRATAGTEVQLASDSYFKLFAAEDKNSSLADVFGAEFLDAWIAEFGASLEGVRTFVEQVEEAGLHPPRFILDLPRSVLIDMLARAAGVATENVAATLETMTLAPRPQWRAVSGEFRDKDWYPWRFRRRLSVLRRPFLQIDHGVDPTIVFAPGLVRDAFFLTIRSFFKGEIPATQARSAEMGTWIGRANNIERTAFNSEVATRMEQYGWLVSKEIRLTHILGRSLARDYGDIDVLAWRPESGRVLVMECKDLQFHKTLGEVAEQLADFRGEIQSNGKPDHLKRHLERLEVLTANADAVSRTLRLRVPLQMEGHLVFKNLVPMRFAWNHMASRVRLSLFSELDRL